VQRVGPEMGEGEFGLRMRAQFDEKWLTHTSGKGELGNCLQNQEQKRTEKAPVRIKKVLGPKGGWRKERGLKGNSSKKSTFLVQDKRESS